MKQILILAAGVTAAMALSASTANAASTVTFNSLPANSIVSTHTENGVTVASGNSNHFHTESTGLIGTAARFYQSDGFPHTISFSGGLFDLESIDFLSFDSGIQAVITASSGAVVTTGMSGTFRLGGGFSGITSAVLTFAGGAGDSSFVLDNIRVSAAVPEPATWAMMVGGFGMVGGAMRSARRKRKVSVSYA